MMGDFSWFRASTWWHHIIPPILPVIYLSLAFTKIPLATDIISPILLYVATLIFTASFGYFLNDMTDIEDDAKAGKQNVAAQFSTLLRYGILFFLLLGAMLPWYYMGLDTNAFYAWILLILMLALYSLLPFRLKEKSWTGIICDAMYGHVLPMYITIFYFYDLFQPVFFAEKILLGCLLLVLLFKGLRNIIVHQINDRKSDRESQLNTFVLSMSPLFSLNLLNKFIIPGEFILLIIFHLILIGICWLTPLFLVLFLAMTYAKFSGWKFFNMPQRQLRFKFWYFLNDYYEVYFPLFAILVLGIMKPLFLLVIILHLLLFPKTLVKIKEDITIVSKNLKYVRHSRAD